MRPRALLPLTVLLALAAPAAATDVEIATGHIALGLPTSLAISTPVDSFQFNVEAHRGASITTITTDNGGYGYDLDVYFYDATGEYVDGCATDAIDEICTVPATAATGEVSGFYGADLDVRVVLAH